MGRYRVINNIIGWVAFMIAFITYLFTIEPTVSFWDCGEFITAAYRLQVGHPPGAPFFMILARVGSLFASDPASVAKVTNSLSALVSAFTILFLFWTITHLAKKLITKNGNEVNLLQTIIIMGSGLVGALAYTFSDTFWFSAVESEVYAMSSFFTAITFWAILKWESVADEPYANRWIVLIAYFLGLSIGIHLLNLLAIPAIVFVYYYKKYKVTKMGLVKTFILSLLLIAVIMYGIIQGLVIVAAKFELVFVNSFHLPYNSGTIFFVLLLIGSLVWGIIYTYKKELTLWNTILTCIAVILIGYSSYAIIPIRSAANPPMDTNNPDNVFVFRNYLNREQYGNRPLFFGQTYNAGQPVGIKNKNVIYIKKDGRYVVSHHTTRYKYNPKYVTFFPRMYSTEKSHINEYANWTGVDPNSKEPISFVDNLRFFINYQCGQMYFRYFMWNFVGKQNKRYIGGYRSPLHSNWLSGISFIDRIRLGNQSKLPSRMKNDPNRNTYYFLPLILGILGIVYQLSQKEKGNRSLWVVFMLFFFTGIAIVFYLNQTPEQPRERDYAYAGSFYAFSIWIGLGVLGIYHLLRKKRVSIISSISIAIGVSFLAGPVLMAIENWDDHDRSGRYFAHDLAYNYLNSCEKNSILFTYGDNDTFPLWYIQDVEGIRTDVRVCNLSYLSSGWYTEQMDRKAFLSERLPFSLTKEQYRTGTRDVVRLIEHPSFKEMVKKDGGIKLRLAMDFLKSDNPRTKELNIGSRKIKVDYLPAKKFIIPVNKEKVLKNGIVAPGNADSIVDKLLLSYSQNNLFKSTIMALDAVLGSDWDRPIYFANTIGPGNMQGFINYLQLEGLAYRLVPIKTLRKEGRIGRVDTEKMYDNIMNKFKWRGFDKPGVLFETTINDVVMLRSIKNNFLRLIEALLEEDKNEKAVNVLDKYFSIFHPANIPFPFEDKDLINLVFLRQYYELKQDEKVHKWIKMYAEDRLEHIEYYFSLASNPNLFASTEGNRQIALSSLGTLLAILKKHDKIELYNEFSTKLQSLITAYDQPVKFS